MDIEWIKWIKKKVANGDYEFSSHADEERQVDKISISEIEMALLNGMLIEDYPNDHRGQSCLILGYGNEGYPIHIVCGRTSSAKLRIITIYIPLSPKWIDDRTRGR